MTTDPLPLTPPEDRAETTGSRWAEIKHLFEAALALGKLGTQWFLDRECGGKKRFGREVLSLLAAYEETGDFLENPVRLGPLAARYARAARLRKSRWRWEHAWGPTG